ncbi:MAG: hypothetical protein AAGC43_01270 [Bacteroidota bacterium]
MKKFAIILFLGLCACKSGFNSTSKNCIEKDQREVLENAVELFEIKIQKQYPKLSKEAAYFEFISEWANKKLPIIFFQDSLESTVRNLNIWSESIRLDKDMDLEKKIFNIDSMNLKRVKLNYEFSSCLSKATTDWDGIRNFIVANSKYRLSPKLALKNLYRTNENDLKQFENRLAIILGVYYQTMFNIRSVVTK